MDDSLLKRGQRLLFIGDSITDCGRLQTEHRPLGVGYVKMFAHLQQLREPAKQVDLINRGIGGHTAEDLHARWDDDVLSEAPDWLFVKIGINDCNRYVTDAAGNAKQSPERFREFLDDCFTRTRQSLPRVQLFLIAPFYLSRDRRGDASYRGRVRQAVRRYQAGVEDLAVVHQARLLDTQRLFEAFLEHRRVSDISNDCVHLNELGALILAEGLHRCLRVAG